MQADLVFRGVHQECPHSPQEISGFAAELVFRDIPGKSVQRSRQPFSGFCRRRATFLRCMSFRQSPLYSVKNRRKVHK
jgi:hypothetical protein